MENNNISQLPNASSDILQESSLNHLNSKTSLFAVVIVFIILSLLVGGVAYSYGFMQGQSSNRLSPSIELIKITSTPELIPSPTEVVQDYPTSQAQVAEQVKTINYEKNDEWSNYISETGYEIQYPPAFSERSNVNEAWIDGGCRMSFGNNVGGAISAMVTPYDGGSRRQLFGTPPGYTYQYEEVLIQGKKSLLIEVGPIGDSGSGTGVVIPVGDKALIVRWSNIAKNDSLVMKLLQSIKLNGELDVSRCQ